MRQFFISITNRHDVVYKYLLVLATVVLIVISLPKDTQFNYSYRKGKPWAYDNLMAPFDFAVNKTDADLNDEKANAMKNIHPFYKVEQGIAEKKINTFNDELEEACGALTDVSSGNKSSLAKIEKQKLQCSAFGYTLLNEIYARGIILIGDKAVMNADSNITTVKNNVAEEKNIRDLFTIQSAFEFINEKLREEKISDKDFLAPLLENALQQNVLYDDDATQNWSKQMLDNISLTRGMVQSGEIIVRRGEVMDDAVIQKLQSLNAEVKNQDYTGNTRWLFFLGHFILVALAISMLILFLGQFRKDIYNDNSRILLLMILIFFSVNLFLQSRKINQFDICLVPVCILPIIVRAFYDTRIALFTHIVTLLIIGFEAPNGFEFMFVQTIAGMTAVFSIVTMSRRSQFFISVLMIFASYTISFIGTSIIHEANFKSIDWMNLKWYLGNSILTLIAFPLIFIFEKMFGFLSDVSLMELSDSNSPLLRELALKAPGTFQHSLQVANLAEAGIIKVGGNPLLVRAGAMYHDIGKIDMPNYFIENQNSQVNPHDDLTFEESARIIKSHVIKGVEKAKKSKMPEQIVDFIRTHHGTSRLQYFYQSFLKNFPGKIPDEEKFCYSGPLPFSKETAVLMMADSVEAASRSLKNAGGESIDVLVEQIIKNQMEQEQFINCPITMKDISDIKKIFKKMLMSIYHVRIEYPQ